MILPQTFTWTNNDDGFDNVGSNDTACEIRGTGTTASDNQQDFLDWINTTAEYKPVKE
jgi:hypothetical protein